MRELDAMTSDLIRSPARRAPTTAPVAPPRTGRPFRRATRRLGAGAAAACLVAGCRAPHAAAPQTTTPQAAAAEATTSTPAATRAAPNIVLVFADDLGWAELASYGNRFNETPHLDRLARDGVRLTQAYAAAPVCSPTRAALMTGRWPARVGITDYLRARDARYLREAHVTLPERLRDAGYATALIGKWHLMGDYAHRRGDPARHGWDEVLLSETKYIADGDYHHPYFFMPDVAARDSNEYLVDRMNREAVDFIRRRHATAPGRPFFLELSHYAVHTALVGKPDLVAKYEAKPGAGAGPRAATNNPHLAAQLESVDEGVGMIVATLRELGLDRNTLLVFTSDNGGARAVTSNAPLRAGKGTLYEGGIRVPLVVWWPAGGVEGGRVSELPTVTMDLHATLLAAAGVQVDAAAVDGTSVLAALQGRAGRAGRDTLFWHYPLDRATFPNRPSASAVRAGALKLVEFFERDSVELYDLAADPGERRDLAAERPAEAARLRETLAAWRRALRTDTLTLPTNR